MPKKGMKVTTQRKDSEEECLKSHASSPVEDDMPQGLASEGLPDVNLGLILKEIRDFRKETHSQWNTIREDIDTIYKRIEEAEDRIVSTETRMQSAEEILFEVIKRQKQMGAKVSDLESRLRRNNVRIFGVREGAEENTDSMVSFVEELLLKGLALPASTVLNIERAHRAFAAKPPNTAPPRSIVVKFTNYMVKEDILRRAWEKKGINLQGKIIRLDHDYAPDLVRKRQEYAEAKAVLKNRNIRFNTPFPARLRVFYTDGTVLYRSPEEATADMAERGLPVTVLKAPSSLIDQLKRLSRETTGNRANRKKTASGLKE